MGQTSSSTSSGTLVARARPSFNAPTTTTTTGGRPAFGAPATSTPVVGYAGYNSLGCFQDTKKLLTAYSFTSNSMSVNMCESSCRGMGYSLSGVEGGTTCYCGSSFAQCVASAPGSCSSACAGSSTQSCGGSNAMNIYAVAGYSYSTSSCVGTTTLQTTTVKPTSTSTTASPSKTTNSGSHYSVGAAYTGVPGATGANKVFAHFMIGNTYSMQDTSVYKAQIAKAISMGIDGFACNIGSDSWQPNRLSLMYEAALSYPGFVIFVSLDMAVLSGNSFNYFYQFITPYTNHANSYKINGLQFLSTFAGESYLGGSTDPSFSDPAAAWLYFKNQLYNQGSSIYFVPAFTGAGATCLGWDALDGALSWNAWTKNTGEDTWYEGARNNPSSSSNPSITTGKNQGQVAQYTGKTYMAGIGPLFFTHFNYKNYVYSNDDEYTTRWENIVSEQPDFVEIISWNDYGESHYIGDIFGSLPYDSNGVQSSTWANSNFDHSPLAGLTNYYINAYKAKGSYPTVTTNSIYMWYRPHSISATASADPYGKPACQDPDGTDAANCPQDNIYVTALLKQAATIKVTSAGKTQTFSGVAGKNHFTFTGFGEGTPGVSVVVGGSTVLSKTASLAISNSIQTYNYNLHYESATF